MLASDLLDQVRRMSRELAQVGRPALERIHVTPGAVRTIEDWSGVRSPARARRRRAKHPQRIRVQTNVPSILIVGGVMYLHPDRWTAFMKKQEQPLKADAFSSGWSIMGIPVTFEAGHAPSQNR